MYELDVSYADTTARDMRLKIKAEFEEFIVELFDELRLLKIHVPEQHAHAFFSRGKLSTYLNFVNTNVDWQNSIKCCEFVELTSFASVLVNFSKLSNNQKIAQYLALSGNTFQFDFRINKNMTWEIT